MNENPLIVASFISTMWKERNPFVLLIKDVKRQLNVMIHLKENMRTSQERIQKLEAQTQKMEELISETQLNPGGKKLNTWK